MYWATRTAVGDQRTECSNSIVDMLPTGPVYASPLEMEGGAFCSGSRAALQSKGSGYGRVSYHSRIYCKSTCRTSGKLANVLT